MMAEYLRIGRLYFVLLAIFAVARFAQGAMGVPYDKAHHVFSIVILTVHGVRLLRRLLPPLARLPPPAGHGAWARCSASSPRS